MASDHGHLRSSMTPHHHVCLLALLYLRCEILATCKFALMPWDSSVITVLSPDLKEGAQFNTSQIRAKIMHDHFTFCSSNTCFIMCFYIYIYIYIYYRMNQLCTVHKYVPKPCLYQPKPQDSSQKWQNKMFLLPIQGKNAFKRLLQILL